MLSRTFGEPHVGVGYVHILCELDVLVRLLQMLLLGTVRFLKVLYYKAFGERRRQPGLRKANQAGRFVEISGRGCMNERRDLEFPRCFMISPNKIISNNIIEKKNLIN